MPNKIALQPFTMADADAWRRIVEANSADPYAVAILEFAARWASLMEAKLAAGFALADIAKSTSHDADTEGITGFMYGAAVSILAKVWVHGDALRRWHNLDVQLGTEGERANATGATLNPALVSIRD